MTNFLIKHDAKATRKHKAAIRAVSAQTKRDDKVIAQATHVLDAVAHYETLCSIAQRVHEWHSTSYKKATDELYVLLSDCYKSTMDIRSASMSVMKQLNKLLKEKKLMFNDGTRLETKVVRVVFGDIGKRAHIYARVLVNAREQHVKNSEFFTWLTAQGGVEAVRKQYKGLSPSQLRAQRIEKAENSLPRVSAKQLSNAPKVDGSDYVLALVQHTNGKQRIVGFCENLTLVKQVLARLADEAEKQADAASRADTEREVRLLQQQLAQVSNTTQKAA